MLFYNFHQYSTEYIIEWTKMGDPNSSQTGNIERGWQVVPTDISSHLPFSAAVEANGFVFVSGQASVDKQGGSRPG
jgi:enamine deaminase RidA (YjgF/YER057c/UK114 family)